MKKIAKGIIITVVLILCAAGAAYTYFAFISRPKNNTMEWGISFSEKAAEQLGLDWKEVYLAMLDELDTPYIRISTYWDRIETYEGRRRYKDIDFMMDEAAKRNKKVIMVLGERQPRWPECHIPPFYQLTTDAQRRPKEREFIEETAQRYVRHPALEMWQIENEPFLSLFGECQFSFDVETIKNYITFLRDLDENKLIMITASGELSTWFKEMHLADVFGTTLYRTVWNERFGYFSYTFLPASFYRVKAAIWGNDPHATYVAELQAEPWSPEGDLTKTPLEDQTKIMNADILRKNAAYAEKTGFYRSYLWGVEWWYWMKKVQNDPAMWEAVQSLLKQQ